MADYLSAAAIYRRYNIAENRHDSIGTTLLVAPDLFVEVNGAEQVASAEEDTQAMEELYGSYPDYRRDILEIIDAGDRATVLWSMRGTPSNSLVEFIEPLDVKGVSVVTGDGNVLTRAALFFEGRALESALVRAKRARTEFIGG